MNDAFYITTPIYYVNASPHLGHAYTTIVADVLARYHRGNGRKTFFLTGTDEHGDKIAEAARKAGTDPKTYADRISGQFRNLWPQLAVTNDAFIRTTDPIHVETVRSILRKVYEAGDIYFGDYEGHYCIGCERFYMEKELVDGLCPDHRTAPEYRRESNYFFRMGKYQDWLVRHIQDHPDFIRPERYRNEALAFLRDPLEDLCISRPKSRLTWGITLPFDEAYVTYVWFDALINYLTGIGYPEGERFPVFWPAAQHLIAKDILKPHGIYWPTMLKAAGISPYRHLNVHGYWNVDQGKMSKSVGNVVRPLELKDRYGLDAFRYYLLRDMVFGLDASFSEDAFVQRLNADLANDLGNLVSRIIAMAIKYGTGVVPDPGDAQPEDRLLAEGAARAAKEVHAGFRELALHKALMGIWEFVGEANRYVVAREPWNLAKDPGRKARLDTVLYHLLEALRVIAVLISPFLPDTAGRIGRQIGLSDEAVRDFSGIRTWGGLPPGSPVVRGEALFPRVESGPPERSAPETPAIEASFKPEITFEDFRKLDLRVAKVLRAEAVPKSHKLLKLTVDLGEERTIVAGIAKDYRPEDLVGRQIVVLANLQPTKLMGVESRGMLLATDTEGGLALLSFDREPKTGAPVR